MLRPELPPYDIDQWQAAPFPQKLKMVCQAWAAQGYGTPLGIYLVYAAKIAFYIFGWAFFCTFTPGQELGDIGTWWATKTSFTKAILWTMAFEGLGLGCGSGPLTARYVPPVGGALYFLRPGTVKLPFFPGLPLIGGDTRTWLDVGLYALQMGLLFSALTAPEVSQTLIVAIIIMLPILGLTDKTLFLAHRSEHYLSSAICLLFPDWIAGNKVVWLAIWWWAATSKVNRHFPAVMCVMTSNAPWTRWGPFRKIIYRDYPEDLRPSPVAGALAHFGTVSEYAFPLLLIFGDGGPLTAIGLFITVGFHLFIVSNVPMGVPLEWNFTMIYGALVLFGVHASVPILSMSSPLLIAWLVAFHFCLPLYGSQYPSQVSFLLSMRYYAGNWAYSVWLFRKDASESLDTQIAKWSQLPKKQLSLLYDDKTITALLSKVMAFRAMHIHGRALQQLIPKAVDEFDEYEWFDGELVAGMVIGWNFGEGHLHNEQLLGSIQKRVGYAPGDLRCVFVESEPIFGSALSYRIVDAADGQLESGTIEVRDLVDLQPWPTGA